ncbi:MAG: hypothetical protein QM660_13060 [Dysgonomonas sp.]
MKNLDLTTLGVEEMTEAEVRKVEGGFCCIVGIGAGIVGGILGIVGAIGGCISAIGGCCRPHC